MEQVEGALSAVVDAEPQQLFPDTESPAEDDPEPTRGEPRAKRIRPSPKATWILTYGASGPYIAPQMLLELGQIKADECHSTKDRVMNFTYIHLTQRVRQSSIEKFMKKAKESHGIVQKDIFGYDSVACISRQGNVTAIEEHVGFQMLLGHYIAKNPAFMPWTDGEPLLKRGRILKAAESDPGRTGSIENNPKARIIQYTKLLESRLREATKQGFKIPSENTDETSEFDVVKKRRTMDSAQTEEENEPEALAAFEQFEQNVLPALELINADEKTLLRAELQEFEDSAAKGVIQSTAGGVYFAWSPCLKCTKIGATRRDNPTPRLQELSRHVTEPFVLTGWIPSTTPFRKEAVAHTHFASKRIRNSGAGTEFFSIEKEAAAEYCSTQEHHHHSLNQQTTQQISGERAD